MCNLYLLRARLGCELTQQERKEDEACWFTLRAFKEIARMEVRLQSVREESLSRTRESIFTRVIGAHVTTRRKEHRPESDPCTELHGATAVRQPGEWASIKWSAIEIPGFKRIRLFRWREQTESCRDRARRIAAGWWRCASCGAWQRARQRNAGGWCAAIGAAPHPFFQFRFQIRLVRCTFKTCGAKKCPALQGVFRARRNGAAAP
jgi:hypothetical protein